MKRYLILIVAFFILCVPQKSEAKRRGEILVGLDYGFGVLNSATLEESNITPSGTLYGLRVKLQYSRNLFYEIFYKKNQNQFEFIHDSQAGFAKLDQSTYGANIYLFHTDVFGFFVGAGMTVFDKEITNAASFSAAQLTSIRNTYDLEESDSAEGLYNVGLRLSSFPGNIRFSFSLIYTKISTDDISQVDGVVGLEFKFN